MSLDQIFELANTTALAGWVILLASPLAPVWSDRLAGYALPFVLAVAYAALVAVHFGGADGGFGSLDGVAALFTQREMVLVGWLHFLAFDLFVGAWEVRTARAEGIPFLLVVPCLVFTFLLGPIGLLLFLVLRAFYRRRASRDVTA